MRRCRKPSGAAGTFTLEGVAPIAAQGLLIRYWLAHGRPAAITHRAVGRRRHGPRVAGPRWRIASHGRRPSLREFTIDGVAWGRQRLWLAPDDLASSRPRSPRSASSASKRSSRRSSRERAGVSSRTQSATRLARGGAEVGGASGRSQRGTFALIGGAADRRRPARRPIEHATVIVRDGRIEAAGARPIDVASRPACRSSTSPARRSCPGLWDMHAHVGLAEWGPVYLASGVTTARDMGGEFDVVTALRDAWRDGSALGPRLLLAGLVDGPGPASFGHVTAANPDEGRAVVRKLQGRRLPADEALLAAGQADGRPRSSTRRTPPA